MTGVTLSLVWVLLQHLICVQYNCCYATVYLEIHRLYTGTWDQGHLMLRGAVECSMPHTAFLIFDESLFAYKRVWDVQHAQRRVIYSDSHMIGLPCFVSKEKSSRLIYSEAHALCMKNWKQHKVVINSKISRPKINPNVEFIISFLQFYCMAVCLCLLFAEALIT